MRKLYEFPFKSFDPGVNGVLIGLIFIVVVILAAPWIVKYTIGYYRMVLG